MCCIYRWRSRSLPASCSTRSSSTETRDSDAHGQCHQGAAQFQWAKGLLQDMVVAELFGDAARAIGGDEQERNLALFQLCGEGKNHLAVQMHIQDGEVET